MPEHLSLVNVDNEIQFKFILQNHSNNTGSYFRITQASLREADNADLGTPAGVLLGLGYLLAA